MNRYFQAAFSGILVVFFCFFNRTAAQFARTDTNEVQAIIDSCRNIEKYSDALVCQQNALMIVNQSLKAAPGGKEKNYFARAAVILLRSIGNIYKDRMLNFPKAKEYYEMSLKKAEEMDYKQGIAGALFNLGNIYAELLDYRKALPYYQNALTTFEKIGEERGIGMCLNGMGMSYDKIKQFDKALFYLKKSLKIQENRQDSSEIATCLLNIANTYFDAQDYQHTMVYYQKCLPIFEKINDTEGVFVSLQGVGDVLMKTGKRGEALLYYYKGLNLAKKSGDIMAEALARKSLRTVYEQQGRYKEALAMNDSSVFMFDSIEKLQRKDEIEKMDLQSDFEKKEAVAKVEHKKEMQIVEIKTKQQRAIIWSVAGGLLLVIVFSGFVFNRWQVTQKQKKIIEIQKTEVETQKHLVEEKQKEIIDSITYAKRLQEAILPPLDFVKKHFPESFILYKPKDIVAGDFYWMHLTPGPSPKERGATAIFIAAADCTGHGVPGAMVSVVCCNALNRAVKEFGLRDTGKILDKVTELVLETFEKSGEDVKDGMDIALLKVEITPSPSGRAGLPAGQAGVGLQWSGANNPLWYIKTKPSVSLSACRPARQEVEDKEDHTTSTSLSVTAMNEVTEMTTGYELIELKPDKQPIGKHDNRKPFTTHTITLHPNSPSLLERGVGGEAGAVLYLFTDGYADQFGGPKAKKFKYRQLEEKLLEISDKPMAEQKEILEKTFENWKGNLEQVDDVTVIGLRI